jgi:altronate hydrolase
MNSQSRLLRISPEDNVAVALEPLAEGAECDPCGSLFTARTAVPRGHKIALSDIPAGRNVIKFGQPIGHALRDIAAGEWVHVHNLKTNLGGTGEYHYEPEVREPAAVEAPRMFDGFVRANGDVGIRNEIWILPTVGCVNRICSALASRYPSRPGIDGVHAFTHPYGCSQLGDDHENTRRILACLAQHPNAAAVLVVGLGCENNTMAGFKEAIGDCDPARFRFLSVQEAGDEMEEGLKLLDELAETAAAAKRVPMPLSSLKVGLKCGGSDGFSGITANPLVGALSDRLIAHGGTSVLTEVPEMFGAETLLMKRCVSREVFDGCVGMINGFKEYFLRHNQVVYENPSPGNKDGGISTLEEKSLGCTQKGGNGPVVDVLPYGGRLSRPGLNLLDGPGNDIVAVTVLAAAGAHMVLFTTGRGTPLGGPVPTVKISSNSELAARKSQWIDFDAGRLLYGASLDELADDLLDQVVAIASGTLTTKAETNGFREIAIFKDGVTL